MLARSTNIHSVSVAQALREAAKTLEVAGHEVARLEAEVLLCHVLRCSRAKLYVEMGTRLDAAEAEAYCGLVQRHLVGEPVAYIIGRREFFGLEFQVDRRVLIPRPETELLVERALSVARQHRQPGLRIADVGTGSGAIAISLAVALPGARIYALDSSSASLEVAAVNCRVHGVQERVELMLGDLLEPLPAPVDIIVANLPYIPSTELALLPPEVALFEPLAALDGGADGLEIYRRLLGQMPGKIAAGGHAFAEIGAEQGPTMVDMVTRVFPGALVTLEKDYAGLDRVVMVEIKSGPQNLSVPELGNQGAL